MAEVQVYSAWRFRCPECPRDEFSTSKGVLVRESAFHAISAHKHPTDDGCGCELVRAVNEPVKTLWCYVESPRVWPS